MLKDLAPNYGLTVAMKNTTSDISIRFELRKKEHILLFNSISFGKTNYIVLYEEQTI